MNREAIYFSHDADASNDPKCAIMIYEMGNEGYGCFWRLVEMLRVQSGYMLPVKMLPVLAKQFDISEAKLKTIVSAYGLFEITQDGMFFFSQSLKDRMELMEEKSERFRLAGLESGRARRAKALLINNKIEQRSNNVQTSLEQNGNDVEQRKEKKRNILKENILKEKTNTCVFRPPTVLEIKAYCTERKNEVDAERFLNFYEAKGWMVGKNKMKDWKAAVRTWENGDKNNKNHENREETRYKML